ncbi:MAG: DUF6448 family protein [Thermodesulfovibrionia bacterium]|nr:DUF6448 family protein [Thermodesulfovibrionia bacterium]
MKMNKFIILSSFMVLIFAMLFGGSKLVPDASAHCDTMNGPVIKQAQKALDAGDVNLILMWVQKKDVAVIKKAFDSTLSVRKLNPQAKELADMYFFETLVRIHREGEGAPYTGIKSADAVVEPGIDAADKAIENGSVDHLAEEISTIVANGIRERFKDVMEKKKHINESVDAGREYVESYVTFIHYVEKLHLAASEGSEHHAAPAEAGTEKKHVH